MPGISFAHSASPGRSVAAVSAALGVCPQSVVATAFRIVLARWTGDWAIPVDVALPARSRTVPLAAAWDPNAGFGALAASVDRALGGDGSHAAPDAAGSDGTARAPGATAGSVRDAGPLRALLTFAGDGPDAPPGPAAPTAAGAPIALHVKAADLDGGGELHVDTADFDPPRARELLRSFETLLRAALFAPDTAAADLAVVDTAFLDALTDPGPAPAAGFPTVDAMFRHQAAATPDAVACIDRHGRWTYRQLDVWAGNVARALLEAGCRPGESVPVAADRGAGLPAALLGVMRAGATYVPLDVRGPQARNQLVLEEIGSRLLLSPEAGAAQPVTGHRTISIDACRPGTEPAPDTGGREPAAAAYTIFTSGSTGRPKGVRVGHAALVHLMVAAQQAVALQPGQTLLAVTTPSFDIAALELFLPLCHGATVEIAGAEEARDPSAIAARLDRSGLALVQATPTLWRAVVESGWQGGDGLRILCGGEELPADLAARLLDRADRVWNVYGPTETTIWSTAAELTEPPHGSVPIGRPFSGERAYVVDERGNRLAPCMTGELWIGGAGVAEGYLGRPGLSAERFPADPFAPHGRVYRTGDLAEFLPDGSLRFHGRRDTQVKIRGHRIELGEIEAVLRADASVADASVVVQGDDPAEQRLAAFVLAAPGAEPDPADLLARCGRLLPSAMMPAAIGVLTAFPLTPSGKTDRAALARTQPKPLPPAGGEGPRPLTGTEKSIAEAFRSVLGITDEIRTDADFFALGGHSLKANQVVTRLRDAGLRIELRDLFEAPTVAGLAATAGSDPDAATRTTAGPGPHALPDRAPLSFAQERFWFQDRLGTTGPEHHIQAAYRITGPLDTGLLHDALQRVVDRHEPLRTVFHEADGRPEQQVLDHVPVDLPVTPVEGRDDAERLHIAHELMRASFLEPFSLRRPPLFRFELFRIGDREHVLHLCMHHICTDGWSMGVIAAEVMEHYRAALDGTPAALPPVAPYRAYALAEREHADGPLFRQQLAEATARLDGLPTATSVLLDRARPERQSVTGGTVRARIDPPLVQALSRLAHACGTTVHSVLLAAYAALLHRHGAGDDMVIAAPTANRTSVETERMVGVFVNTLPVPVRHDPRLPFADLVRQVHQATLDALGAAQVPFDRIVDALQIPRSLAALPLTQVAFVWHNAPMPDVALPGVDITPMPLDTGMSMYDLRLVGTEHSGGIDLQLDHAADILDAATAATLLERLTDALGALLTGSEPGARPLPVAVAARPEPYTSGAPQRPPATIPELFRAAARAHPEAPAVSCGELTWSYRELDRRSDAVAAALLHRGVRHGTAVAVMAERGPDLAAALLGTVKLGAFYTCLDRTLPESRIDFMLRDLGCGIVLTDHAGAVQLQRAGLDAVDLGALDPDAPFTPAGPEPAPDDIAYVTYTSGTTGTPKGTLVPHRAVAGFWRDAEYADFGPGTVFLGHSSTSWDALTLEFWSMALSGGCCHFVPEPLSGPADLARHRAQGGADTAWLTAAFFHALVDAEPGAFTGMRQILVGGEAVSARHLREFRRHQPDTTLVNGYGPSECTVFTACHPIPREVPQRWTSVPIGRPVGDRQVWILDESGRPVPPLVPGELCVGGDAVALGYLNRPDLTRERFVTVDGTRLYRTGDRVRRRGDGLLEFLGRRDDQIKLRGFRIELGEIERALTAHPAVHTAAVVLHTDEHRTPRLAAYVTAPAVPGERRAEQAAELDRHLRTSLPAYMVPAAIRVLAELPRRPTGKVDRDALPEPVWHDAAPAGGPAAGDGDPRVGALAAIWADVLGLDGVGPDDNFFDIGGDSITSIQVVVRAREAGIAFDPKDLFDHQTVRSVIAVAAGPDQPTEAADQSALTGEIPLAPVQHWMFGLGLEDVHRFPQSLLLDFAADPGEPVLQRALDAVAGHHDMLRARFAEHDGRWTQRYGPAGGSVPLTRETLDPRRPEAEQIEELVAAANRGIDLTEGPVFRALWITCGDGTGKLFLVAHHLCIDGYSWNVLLDDLLRGLRTPADKDIALPARTSSYRDWVHALQTWSAGAEAAAQLGHWRAQRGRGIPWLAPASDRPWREVRTTELPDDLARALLREVPAHHGAEPVEVMIAALAAAVLQGGTQSELLLELEHHGRDALDGHLVLDRTVGWFTSLYPVLLRAPDDPGLRVKAAQNAVRGTPGSGQGHGVLRYLAGHDLPGGADVRFNYLGRFDALQAGVEGVALSAHTLGDHASRPRDGGPALNITAFTLAGRLRVRWDHRGDRIPHTRLTALADGWQHWLRTLCDHCLGTAGHVPVAADFPLADVDQSHLDALMEDL